MRSTKGKAMGAAFLGIPVVIAWVASGLATACTSSAVTPCDLADCTETGPGPDVSIPDSGKDGDVPPPGCDSLNDPLKNPEKCFTDENWAYVSPSGDDGGAGTKGKPFKSLKKALEGGKIRIAVCEGTYTESVDVTRDVTIQSGFSCDFTKAGAKAKVVGTKPDYAVSVAKPAGNVALRDLVVVAVVVSGSLSIQLKAANGAICTLSLSFNNDGPLGTFFRYIGDSATYIARYDDLYTGKEEKIDVCQVAVSTNGIELQDREFLPPSAKAANPTPAWPKYCPATRCCTIWSCS